jgi:hypothetical protein
MGHAFLFASLLGLIAFAFGAGAAVAVARFLIIAGSAFLLWIAYLVVFERI